MKKPAPPASRRGSVKGARAGDWVGITTIAAGPALVELVRAIEQAGFRSLVVAEPSQLRAVQALGVGPSPTRQLILAEGLVANPVAAARGIVDQIRRLGLGLRDWLNFTDQTTVAFLLAVEQMGLRFPFLEPYRRCRVKALARETAWTAGLSRIKPQVIWAGDAAPAVNWQPGKVIKPICGSGSELVRIIKSDGDWNRARRVALKKVRLNRNPVNYLGFDLLGDFVAEPLLKGEEYEIDGYVTQGDVFICALGRKLHDYGPRGFRELGGVIYHPGSLPGKRQARLDASLVEWAQRLLRRLAFPSGVFHIEVMVHRGGEIELIEINPRFGGGTVVRMVEKVSGVNLREAAVPLWLGKPFVPKRRELQTKVVQYAIRYPSRQASVSIHPAEWNPLRTSSQKIRREELMKECYLGEFHLHKSRFSSDSFAHDIRALYRWLKRSPLITE